LLPNERLRSHGLLERAAAAIAVAAGYSPAHHALEESLFPSEGSSAALRVGLHWGKIMAGTSQTVRGAVVLTQARRVLLHPRSGDRLHESPLENWASSGVPASEQNLAFRVDV
jgi:hypothetical protein